MPAKKSGLIISIALLIPITVVAMAMAGSTNPWEKKLPFKAATIQYTLSGMETGVETLYIRDQGQETATYRKSKTSMMGAITTHETIEIESPDWIYTFDLVSRAGTKRVNPQKYMIDEYQHLSASEKKQVEENIKKTGLPMSEAMGGKIEAKAAKILGYDCDRVQIMGTTVYSIHDTGIPLKIESNMMGMNMKQEATSVNEGAVAAKYFEPPQGIEAVADPESEAMARSLAQQTLAALKSPDGAKKMQELSPVSQMMPQAGGQQMSPEEKKEMEQAMEMLKGMMENQK